MQGIGRQPQRAPDGVPLQYERHRPEQITALMPRPRLHLIRFHSVLAPHAKLRPLVVPKESDQPGQSLESAATAEYETEDAQVRPDRISWARLLKRVFDIDIKHCPNCGGAELKIIAATLAGPRLDGRCKRAAQTV